MPKTTGSQENITINRTENLPSPSCGNIDVNGCREISINKVFSYEGCNFKIQGYAWICNDQIIIETAFELASGSNPFSGPCYEIVKKQNQLKNTPFVGAQLLHNYMREIHENLQLQLRNDIINNDLNQFETLNFSCSASNPCGNPVTKSFKSLRVDCWSYCEDGSIQGPDPNDPPLPLLRRAKCGYGGCCIETRPFCIDGNGDICYGSSSDQVVNDCEQENTNFIDPCTLQTQYCPEVCL